MPIVSLSWKVSLLPLKALQHVEAFSGLIQADATTFNPAYYLKAEKAVERP